MVTANVKTVLTIVWSHSRNRYSTTDTTDIFLLFSNRVLSWEPESPPLGTPAMSCSETYLAGFAIKQKERLKAERIDLVSYQQNVVQAMCISLSSCSDPSLTAMVTIMHNRLDEEFSKAKRKRSRSLFRQQMGKRLSIVVHASLQLWWSVTSCNG